METFAQMTEQEEIEEGVRIELHVALTQLRAAELRHHELVTIGMRSTLEDIERPARFAELSELSDRMDVLIPTVNLLQVIVNGFDEG